MRLEDILVKVLKKRGFREKYGDLELQLSIVKQVIKKRVEKGLTQKQLAQKIGTKQSAIARLESGNANPSIAFLEKIARALDSKLQIYIR